MIDNLPNGWKVEKLGNLVKRMHQGINTAADKVEFSNSGYPILQTKNISKGIIDFNDTKYMNNEYWEKYKEKYKPKTNDILLANIGTIGKNVIVKEESDYLIHWNIFLIEPNQTLITTNYLKSFFDKLYNQNYYDLFLKGGTVKFISKSFLIDLEIPIPPLQQQEKIVKVLDLTSNLIEKQKELLEKYDLFLKSKFIEMFGDPIINPMGWEVKKLKDLSTLIMSGNTPKGGSEVYVDKGILFFRSQNVWKNKILLDEIAYIDNETHSKMKKSSLKHKDILMTKTGRFNTENSSLGRASLFLGKDDSANINGHVYLIRLKKNMIHRFVVYILTTNEYRDYIRKICVGGIDKRQINKTHLEDFPIIFPPLELQNKFSSIVEKIEIIKEKENQKLKQFEDLHNSMMNKAFKGDIK